MLQSSWSKHLGTDMETSDYFVTIIINCAENLQLLQSCIAKIDVGSIEKEMSSRRKMKLVWRDEEVKVLFERLKTSKEDIAIVLAILQA